MYSSGLSRFFEVALLDSFSLFKIAFGIRRLKGAKMLLLSSFSRLEIASGHWRDAVSQAY